MTSSIMSLEVWSIVVSQIQNARRALPMLVSWGHVPLALVPILVRVHTLTEHTHGSNFNARCHACRINSKN